MMKQRYFLVVFSVWVALWAHFTVRELFIKGRIHDYRMLLSRSLEGKRAFVTGDRFYEFLRFCGNYLPERATYRISGVELWSHDSRRAHYYLYPRIEREDGEYLLEYIQG